MVVSTQHAPDVSHATIRETIIKQVIQPVLPADLVDDKIIYHINPTGKFVVGGPHGDAGVTGRKIIVDTYGGRGRHGGGAFSGKDPTKVDRSAAYMARYVAKNIVAAGLADRCEIQLAYAIGVSEPVSVHVDTEGTGQIPDAQIAELVRKTFPLTPAGIIKHLDLRRPIYRKTASGGHFGRSEPEFTWEKTDKAEALRQAAGAAAIGLTRSRDPPDRIADVAIGLGSEIRIAHRPTVGSEILRSGSTPASSPGGRPCPRRRKTSPAPRSPRRSAASRRPSARAPGRVELLGNHTDYNGGLVLAAAIDRSTVVVGRPVAGRRGPGPLGELRRGRRLRRSTPSSRARPGRWGRYVRGVDLGDPRGVRAARPRASRPPWRATSRSAPGCPARRASRPPSPCSWPAPGCRPRRAGPTSTTPARMDLAQTSRRSENEFVGVASGLLDQFSALFGRADHAFVPRLPDASTTSGCPLGDPAPAIVVCDSKTSRRLADGMYNRRRAECERVVDALPGAQGAADRSGSSATSRSTSFEDDWDALDPVGRLRARHVLTENDRVRPGGRGPPGRATSPASARLMSASHASSRDDFENSSPALDALIEAAEESPGFLGGKLSGAGWAGCTVNLVAPDRAGDFAEASPRATPGGPAGRRRPRLPRRRRGVGTGRLLTGRDRADILGTEGRRPMATAPGPFLSEYIAIQPGYCGGEPHIRGHRIKVRHVAVWHVHHGMSPAEIVNDYPTITLAQVHAGAGLLLRSPRGDRAGHRRRRCIRRAAKGRGRTLLAPGEARTAAGRMARAIRFHLDENVPAAIASGLRRAGIDVTRTQEVGLMGAFDEAQAAWAPGRRTGSLHAGRRFSRHRRTLGCDHAGIAYCRQRTRSIGQIVRSLTDIWEILEPSEMAGRVEYL